MKSSSRRVDPVSFIVGACGLDLREFQRDWLTEAFREHKGIRVYSNVLWGLPRGNGKTEVAGAVALKMLVADAPKDGRPAEVYIAAGSRDQASLAFKSARRMVEGSPFLRQHLRVLPGYKRILGPNDSSLHIISADGPLQHGLQPSCVIFDEVWNQRKRDLWEALVGGLIKRPEALLVAISSAGYDQDSLLWELCRRGEKGNDPRFFYRWHSADHDLPYDDPKTWRLANPAMACEQPFLQETGLEDSLHRMHESEFRRWHLGQWTSAEESWIEGSVWDACNGEPDLPDGSEVVLGVDAAIRHDSTVVATVRRAPDGTYHVKFRAWLPRPGHEIQLVDVEDYIREQGKRYRVNAVVYDPQYMIDAAQRLESEGMTVVEWKQDNARMVPATRTLYEAVVHGRLRHGGDQIARSHALAAGVRETERGLRIKKTESRERIDALVALAMAVEWLSREPAKRRSAYDDRPLLVA